MPELPDLEVFKVNVFNRLSSKRLVGIEIYDTDKVHVARETFNDAFAGKNLLVINRVGKELFFEFEGGKALAAHLMLNGEISIVAEEAVKSIRYKIFSMSFERETIVLSDRGGLCTVKYMPPQTKTPDAFDEAFTLEYFLGVARKKARVNIKALLIDQAVVKGIGNAYADEILWAARISPYSLAGKIPEDRMAALYHAIGGVLHSAVDSIKRISPDIISGEERSFLKVHNKNLKETETGYPVIVEKIASKITYYTKEQIEYL